MGVHLSSVPTDRPSLTSNIVFALSFKYIITVFFVVFLKKYACISVKVNTSPVGVGGSFI